MDREKAEAFVRELNALVERYGLMLHGDGVPYIELWSTSDNDSNKTMTVYEDLTQNRCYLNG